MIWLTVGILSATQTLVGLRAAGMQHNWPRLSATLLLSWLPWAFLSPMLLRLGKRSTPASVSSAPAWVVHLLAFGAIVGITAAWTAGLEKLLDPWSTAGSSVFLRLWIDRIYRTLLQSLLLYVAILGTGYVLYSRERLQQQYMEKLSLSEQLTSAQLQALRSQLEPHFLFNALNAIAGQVRENRNDAAVEMIAALSDVLRAAIRDSSRPEVPLCEEIEILNKYFVIEQARYGAKLQVDLQIPQELSSAMVPSLLLQPIAENAVRHGISRQVHGGAVRIKAVPSGGFLNLSIYNDGPALAADWELGCQHGVGLSNLRRRLLMLYGEAHSFSIRNQQPCGVEVCISLPLRET